jgi:hypothetical protein
MTVYFTFLLVTMLAAKMHYSAYFLVRRRQRVVRNLLARLVSVVTCKLLIDYIFPGAIEQAIADVQSFDNIEDALVPVIVGAQFIAFMMVPERLANFCLSSPVKSLSAVGGHSNSAERIEPRL